MPITDGKKETPEGPWDEVKHKIAIMELNIASLQNDISSLENLAQRSYGELKFLRSHDLSSKLALRPNWSTILFVIMSGWVIWRYIIN